MPFSPSSYRPSEDGPAEEQVFTLDDMLSRYAEHPVGHMATYWRDLQAGAETAPLRSAFSPASVPEVLAWMVVFDIEDAEDGGLDFRYCLVGESMRKMIGKNVVGERMRDVLSPEVKDERHRRLEDVVKTEQPFYGRRRLPVPGRDFIITVFGFFPFRTDDGAQQVFLIAAPE